MALLSFVKSAPRAYRLKASNAAPPFSTSAGTSANRRASSLRLALEPCLFGEILTPDVRLMTMPCTMPASWVRMEHGRLRCHDADG